MLRRKQQEEEERRRQEEEERERIKQILTRRTRDVVSF